MKKVLALMLALAMVFSFAACGKKEEGGEQKVEAIVLRASSPAAPDAAWTMGLNEMAKQVEALTGGRYHVDVYPNASLSENSEKTMTDQLFAGTLDIAICPASLAGAEWSAFSIPFQFKDRAHIWKVCDSDIVKGMSQRMEAKGMKVLAIVENGFRQFTNSKHQIAVPADTHDVKLRTPQAKSSQDQATMFGFQVVPMSAGELFVGLQQGTADGQENPLNTIYNNGYYEVQKYLTHIDYSWSPALFAINVDLWESLSAEDQKAFQDAFNAGAKVLNDEMVKADEVYLQMLKDKGMEVYEVSDAEKELWKEAAKDAINIYADGVNKETPNLMQDFAKMVESLR